MTLQHAVYRPTGTLWTRIRRTLFTAYVNVHLRAAESEGHFYRQLERLGIL